MRQLKNVFCMLTAIGFGLALSVAHAGDIDKEIAERIAPAGKSCLIGSDCAAAPVAAVASGPRSGDQVYTTKCSVCHATGVAGAPKLGDIAAWAPRIGKGNDSLYTHAISGFNGMPAKGLCMDCSDDEIKAAVDHMVIGSK